MAGSRRKERYYQVGGNLGRGAGTIAGQALIPVPGIGGAVGGFVGQGLGQGFESLLSALFSSRDPNDFEPTQSQDVGTVTMREGGSIGNIEEVAKNVISSASSEKERLRKLFNSGNLDKKEFGRLINRVNKGVEFAKNQVGDKGGVKGNKKQFGGQVPLTNSAVEFRGPIHEDGGIPLPGVNAEVEGGETMDQVGGTGFIFSNTLKIPGTSESFADRHKKLAEAGASRSAVNKLASLQESVKISSGRKPRSKKQFGGIIDDPNRLGEITVEGGESGLGKLQPAGVSTGSPIDYGSASLSVPNFNFDGGNNSNNGEGVGKKGLFLHEVASRVAPFAGDIINTARGLFGRVNPEPATRINRDHINNFPTTINVRPEIDSATRAYRNVVSDPGVSGQQQLSAHASHLQNLSRIHGERTRAETGLATQKAQLAGRASELDAYSDAQRRQETGALRAARSALLSEGIAGFARTLQAMRAEDLQHESNLIGLASLMTQLPENQRERFIDTVLSNLPENRRSAFKKMVGRGQ